ncbi:oxysterol-binding protein-related protein 1D isoform X3 [Diospyros lotus]|uniref:oxysterol-binding protein-related protein 1D isoform X3 n=1 Tax=Diospyros lotus TaxID=55363 RepID=UPI00224F6A18|nr:oxysterol-binding protein-related protein 1D isoform X3 [Diospyros lotus]
MNPLCCIAPVSIERDRANPAVVKPTAQLGFESSVKNVAFGSKPSFSTQASSVGADSDGLCAALSHEAEESVVEPRDSKVGGSVAGVLYKWVNYAKGWRARWFMLEDGVLSYYKIHGPDKIVMSPSREKGVKVIGEDSLRYMKKSSWSSNNRFGGSAKQWKPFGEIHLKVSSIRASKSDDKRLSIFTGTKTLHLRCLTKEDRAAWIDALLAAKDQFPRVLTSIDFAPSEYTAVSTDKLRSRLLQEGISEMVIKDCESIMLYELSELQNQLKALQLKHIMLLDKLRQLETEKIELEATVVDETKERKSFCVEGNGRFSDFYSIMSEGSASDSDADNESRDGVDVDTDEEDGMYFDTNDFLSSESLRSVSYRSRENMGNDCSPLMHNKESLFSDRLREAQMEIKPIEYPFIKRRFSLPEPKEKEKPVGLWSIIKDNIGKDLSGVCLPVYFNEPLSSLQKCFEDLEYSYLIDRALEWGKQGNDLMRILNVAAFAVSGYASTEGRQCKPFNPLLGETYEADYPDKGLRFFSEKVSHHPMVVACHCEGRGWKFWADSNLKGKFWGRSIQLDPVGALTLQFEDGETFQWSKVTTSIYNIIIGKIYCDHYGTMRIKGSGNYSCKLKFKEQSIIDRNPHQVHGFVQDNRTGEKAAILVGKWDEAMYYVLGDPTIKPKGYDPMTEAVLLWERDKSVTKTRYNLTPFAISLNELTPGLMEKLPPTDSRLRPDQRHLENGEYELANTEKLRLEHLQRQGPPQVKLCGEALISKLLDRRWTLLNPDTKIHQIVVSAMQTQNQDDPLGNTLFTNNTSPCFGDSMMKKSSLQKSFYVVRDDLLHPLVNGNKARKLDALFPLVEDHSVTDVVTCGGCQSAHTAAIAVSCAERGIRSHLLLRGEQPAIPTGYNLISALYGNVIYVPRSLYANREEMLAKHADLIAGCHGSVVWLSDILEASLTTEISGSPNCEQLDARRPFKRAFVVNEGAGDAVGLLGVIRLVKYLSQNHVFGREQPVKVVVDAGTGTTAIGLALGAICLGE